MFIVPFKSKTSRQGKDTLPPSIRDKLPDPAQYHISAAQTTARAASTFAASFKSKSSRMARIESAPVPGPGVTIHHQAAFHLIHSITRRLRSKV